MSVYVIAETFLEEVKEPKPYFNNVLLLFAIENALKVGIDTQGVIIDRYNAVGENIPLIAHWIQIMSHYPSYFEPIDKIDLQSESCRNEIYLNIASQMVEKSKLVCFSKQNLKAYKFLSSSYIDYDGIPVKVLDKDEAIQELKSVTSQGHSGSGDNVGGNKITYE